MFVRRPPSFNKTVKSPVDLSFFPSKFKFPKQPNRATSKYKRNLIAKAIAATPGQSQPDLKMLKPLHLIMLVTFLQYVVAVLDPTTPKPNSSIPVEFYPATSMDVYNDLHALNKSLQIINFHVRNQKLNESSDSVLRFLNLLKEVNKKLPELQSTYDKVDKEREMDTIRNNYSSESNLLQTNISNNSSGILILCVGVVVVLAVSLVIVWFFV